MRISRLLACAVTLVTASLAPAQTWNNYTGLPDTNWSTAANWVGGVPPVSSPNTFLTFTSTPPQTVPPALGFQPTGSYASTNNASTPFAVNQILFNGFGSPDINVPGITVTSSVATGGISFQGSTPFLVQNGSGSVLLADGAAAADIQLTNALTIGGSGIGHLTIAGTITGSGSLTIAQNGGTPLFSGAQVMLTPAATPSNFIGSITLQAGNLALGGSGSPLGNSNNPVTIQGGSLRSLVGASFIPNPINLVNRLTLTGTQSFVFFSGNVSGDGGIRVAYTTLNSASFQAPITGSGDIIVDGIGFIQNSLVLTSNGTATAAASYTVNSSSFIINNVSNLATPRLNTGATLNLGNASFTLLGGAAVETVERLQATTLDGATLFTITPTNTRSAQFLSGTLNRMNKATFQVTTTGAGLTLGGVLGVAGNATLRFDSLSASDNINGVLPFGFALIQTGPGVNDTAQTFVRHVSINGIVPLNFTTDYTSSTQVAFNTIGLIPSINYRLALPKNTVEASTNNPRINSLLIENNGAAATTLGGAIYGTGTIQLTSGALATTLVGGSFQPSFLGTAISKNIDFGPQGYLHAHANTALLGTLSGVNGLVKAGSGSLLLTGTNSTLMGLTINNGTVSFSRDANLGNATSGITLGTGQNSGALAFVPNSQFETPVTNSLTINRFTTLTSGAGQFAVTVPNTTLIWNGQIVGPGKLVKSGTGTLALNGTNNYFGDTVITAGAIVVASNASLGSSTTPISNVILSGTSAASAALFQVTSNFTSNRNFLVTSTTAGANAIFTSSDMMLTLSGNIGGSQPGTPLHKIGTGTLVLTANNSINGAFTIGDALPFRRPSAPAAQHGGMVTLSDLNGTLAAATSYTLNNGSLTLDNSVSPNFNRVSSSSVTANGAELRFIGNANSSTFEHIGMDATAGFISNSLGNTITLEQPAGSPTSANLVLTGLTPTAITFFRGSNLGNSSAGGFTRIIFTTPPALTNNLIPGAFFSNTSNGAPTDFATYQSSTNGVEALPAANYTPFPVAGGGNTQTLSLSNSTITVTGPVLSNALRIDNSTINLSANSLTFTGNAGLILALGASTINGGTLDYGNTPARIATTGSLAINGELKTNGGLNKFGAGTLALSASTVTGGYHISQGTLRLTSAAGFSNDQALTLAVGSTFDVGGNGTPAAPVTAANITGFGSIVLNGSATFANAASVDTPTAFGGEFVGGGTFIHNFTGSPPVNIPTYNGQSIGFTGNVQILGGSLIVDSATAFGTSGHIQLGNTSGSQAVTFTLGVGVTQFDKSFDVPLGSSGTVTLSTGTSNRVSMLTGTITLGRTLTLTGAGSTTGHVPGATTLSGVISNDGIQTGSIAWGGGNYSLTAANTFSGGITVNATVRNVLGLGHDSALGTGPITIANSASTGSFRADGGPRTIANALVFAPGTTANTIGFVGVNNLTFTSPVVNLGSATRTFEVTSLGKTTFTGQFTGTSMIDKTGAGTLKLTNNTSTFSGGFRLTAGKLAFGSSSVGFPTVIRGPIGTGPLIIAGCDIIAEDGPQMIDNAVMVMADFTVDGMNDITMGGVINIGTSIKRIVITNTGSTNFSNTISGGPGGGVIKDGPGSLTLTGNNSAGYTGGTTVTQGKLQINSQIGSGLPVSGMTNVETGATLEGNGIINSDVMIEPGGNFGGGVSASPSVGTLTSNGGTITLASNSTTLVGITVTGTPSAVDSGGSSGGTLGNPANNNFILKTAGTLNIQPGAKIVVDLGGAVFNVLGVNYSYNIMNIQGTQIGAFAPGDVSFVDANGYVFQGITINSSGGQMFLNFTPTSEPATVLAIAAVALGLIRRRRA